MKTTTRLGIKRTLIGAALAALSQGLLARGPADASLPCPPEPPGAHEVSGAQPPGMPGMPPAGAEEARWLNELDLSEAQRDAIFDLMHAQRPARRTLERKAGRALDALHRLAASDAFEARAARALASDYAQAVADLAFNRAQTDAQLRALLTREQRQRVDAPPPGGPRAAAGPRD